MVGQFSELERKSIEPIALAVKEGNIRAMQRFISEALWDDNKILYKYHSMVNDDLGDPNGVLIFDETGFVKKGDDSIGVGRQYCGTIGKVENCQVGVFASYASPQGYALIDKKLFIPYLSNAPVSARLPIFVWLSGLRWAIEQCFEETKSELGMDQYEVRKHRGWNHHILMCMLAHFFLWHLKIRLGGKHHLLRCHSLEH